MHFQFHFQTKELNKVIPRDKLKVYNKWKSYGNQSFRLRRAILFE